MKVDPNNHVVWRKRAGAVLATGALILTPALTSVPAVASPDGDDVVINEIYTRGGSSGQPFKYKFVELYNPTSDDISVDGWSLQYRSKSNTGNGKVDLTGVIPADGYYLIQGGSNADNGEDLPTPDADSGAINPAAGAGTLALVGSTDNYTFPDGDIIDAGDEEVIDLVGYGDAAVYEGEPASSPQGQGSLERVDGVDTDDNSADFIGLDFPTPTNSDGEAGGPPPPAECDHVPEGRVEIAEVQGEGDVTPFLDCDVTTAGVVTAVYPTGGFNGAYIQTPGTGGEIDLLTHTASDGIFVYGTNFANDVEIGDYVEVTGEATEYFELTQIALPDWTILDEEYDPVEPALIEWPETDEERERFEGMLIDPQGTYTVTNLHQSEMYGEIGLAFGDSPLRQPTEYARPLSSEALEIEADNEARALRLDDGSTWNYINFDQDYHETPLPYLSHDDPVRVGAEVTFNEPMILDYRNEDWKLQPTSQVVGELEGNEPLPGQVLSPVDFENTRAGAPDVGGDVTIGAFNVLNYFTDLGVDEEGCGFYTDREGEPSSADWCDVRGSYSPENLERQTAKIVAAITELDADILALQEVENTISFPNGINAPEGIHARDAALAQLVVELNEVAGSGTWDYVPTPDEFPEEEDVIRNAFIYQPAEVGLVGESDIMLDSPAFHNAREPLTQQFTILGDDGEIDEDAEVISLVTTHLKSKGSGDGENADQGDGQGASVIDRVNQAVAMSEYIDELVDGGISPNVFILGDLNSYTMEDPMMEFYDHGFIDVGTEMTDIKTYSYDGMIGSLDHVLANETAMDLVADAEVWSINAYEAVALEFSRYNYNVAPLYQPTPYRSSDHDPMVVGLNLKADDDGGDGDGEDDVDGEDQDGNDTDADGDDTDSDGTDTDADGTDGDDADGADGDDGSDPDPDGELEQTGVSMGPILLAAVLFLVGGAVITVVRSRTARQ